MASKNINLLFRSKILVGLILPALFLLGLVQIAQGYINTQYFRQQIEQAVREKTGRDVIIRGEISLSLLPIPTFYLPAVELQGTDIDKPVPALTVEMVSIRPHLTTILSRNPKIASITLEKPVLELERAPDKLIHWDWLNSGLLRLAGGEDSESVALEIKDGGVLYHNANTGGEIAVQNIYASGATGRQPKIRGSLLVYGHEIRFDAQTSPPPGNAANGALPVKIQFSSDKDTLALDGTVDFSSDEPQINGKINLGIENILAWTKPKVEERHQLFDQITNVSTQKEEQKTVLPVSFAGEWAQAGSAIQLTISQFQGFNSAGTGALGIEWVKNIPSITANFDFSALDYGQWKSLADDLSQNKAVEQIAAGYQQNKDQQVNPLPSDMAVSLDINARQIYFNGQVWEKARLSAKLDNAAVTINQFDIHLPGESSLSLFGIISQSSTKGLRFEGSMETEGKSLRQALTIFDASALDLPEMEFAHFYVRSNVYVASDQIRLSEADAKISELHLNGGLVAYYDTMPRLEADVKLKDINFDYFRDAWRKRQKESGKENFFLRYDKSQSFSWLKRLHASIDFKVNVDGFTFLDREGDSASFRIFAKEGEFGIYNIHLSYPGDVTEASFSLSVAGDQPSANILLNTSVVDTHYFSAGTEAHASKEEKSPAGQLRWSEDLIDMGWMDGINGVFDISVGKLIYGDKAFDNVKLRAKLENSLLTLQGLTFGYWQGKCVVNGSLYGGKVPGLSIGFTLYNAELQDILKSLSGHDNITGKISISGTLATSGVNYQSWVSQAEAELVFSGRGVEVKNFNLPAVVEAVGVSRTAADVVNSVNLVLTKGSTEMSVDGNINVKSGLMRTPGITLRAGSIAGNLTGDIKLLPWTMDLSALYQFPAMTSETVPTMTVQIVGPINAPEMRVDTASLEAYVAKRLTGSSIGK